jgi:hypothetical protein
VREACAIYMVAASVAFLVGCSKSETKPGSSVDLASQPQAEISVSPEVPKANIAYRHLTALKEYPTDVFRHSDGRHIPMSDTKRQLLTLACREALGFQVDMPVGIIKSAREIEIPIEHVLHNPSITIRKVREVDNGTTQVGEVFVNNEPTRITYEEVVNLPGGRAVRGMCIGSEYIIE